jgi:DNA-binding Lrp family transcriptional regulator
MVITNGQIIYLDEIDREILELLQNDAKITINEISEKVKDRLGLDEPKSATAIRARVKRLEKDLIKKYMAIIDCSKLGYHEMVIASLRVNSQQPIDDIKKEIESLNQVKYAYIVTGEYPLIVMFKCLNHANAMVLIEKLRKMPGVEEIKTQIVLDRIKEDHSIIIPEEEEEE